MAKPQYSGPWQRIRKTILERDGHLCQIRGSACTTYANEVDHIVPTSQGGAWFDPINLRAACAQCNNKRVNRRRTDRWREARTRIVLVAGPPGTSKSDWVDEQRGPHDLVVDYDSIASALGADTESSDIDAIHNATNAARNAVIDALRKGKVEVARAWIISSNPRAEQFFPFHDIVIVDPGHEAALDNAQRTRNPGRTRRLVDEWYTARKESVSARTSRDW